MMTDRDRGEFKMMAHTQGSLEQCTVLHATENHHGFNLVDGRGWRIGCIEPIDKHGKEGASNARRLVACWNACEGIDTNLLEKNPALFSDMRSACDALQFRIKQQASMVEKCIEEMNRNADIGVQAGKERDALAAAANAEPLVAKPDALPDSTPCNPHPDAPHGFNRNGSHSAGRYVCDCEGWISDWGAESAQGVKP